jgi:acyl carrier protein
MEEAEIREVILANLRDVVEGMEDIEIDTAKPITEYGAESIDILEVVGSSAREVGVKAKREDLAGIETVDQLAHRFYELQFRPATEPTAASAAPATDGPAAAAPPTEAPPATAAPTDAPAATAAPTEPPAPSAAPTDAPGERGGG